MQAIQDFRCAYLCDAQAICNKCGNLHDGRRYIKHPDQVLITGVAIKVNDCVCAMPKPHRHHDIIGALNKAGLPYMSGEHPQGFVTFTGAFISREEAAQALHHDQRRLYSEDLW
jgi:uncharacterized NAD(P)/FAD-binding protein YdhS